MRNSALTAILLGGLIAGTVDIFAAALINHINLVVILHSIASGLLGKNSFYGGGTSAAIGLILQWTMGLIIAAIYVFASRSIPALARRWIWGGLAYGVGIYFVMNFVVVPLSAAPFRNHPLAIPKAAEDMLAMLLFGLIVAFFASRSMPSVEDS